MARVAQTTDGYFEVFRRLWPLIEKHQQLQVLRDLLRASGMSGDRAYDKSWSKLTADEKLAVVVKFWPELSVKMHRTFATRMIGEECLASRPKVNRNGSSYKSWLPPK